MRSSKIHLAKALKTCDQELQDKEQEFKEEEYKIGNKLGRENTCRNRNIDHWKENWKEKNRSYTKGKLMEK